VPGHHHTAAQRDHRGLELMGNAHHAVRIELLHYDHIKAARAPENLLQCLRAECLVAGLFSPLVQQKEFQEMIVECALLKELKRGI